MEREAFARARSFLNYHAVARWTALIAAVGTSILYVVLLIVLGLFADLVVHGGQPSTEEGFIGRLVSWLLAWNPWMARAGEGGGAYLTWLLGVAVGLALVRALLMFLMNYMAARAVLEATTRCAGPSTITPSAWARWPSAPWGRAKAPVSSPATSSRSTTPCTPG